jgi:hypothetical protein
VFDELRRVLEEERDIAYALLFGLLNLVAHQYSTLDWARLYAPASSSELDDLEAFCAALAAKLR